MVTGVRIDGRHARDWLRRYTPGWHFQEFELGGLIAWSPCGCDMCGNDVVLSDLTVLLPNMTFDDAIAAGLVGEDIVPRLGSRSYDRVASGEILCASPCLDDALLDADEGDSEARMIGMELGIDAYNDARGMSVGEPPYCDQCGFHHSGTSCPEDDGYDGDDGLEHASPAPR